MNKFPLFILLLLVSPALAADAPRKLAFERNDNWLWVSNLDGTGARKIVSGVDPSISPDGMKLAFNTEGSGPGRRIAVADLATGNVTVFKDVPSDNCFGPVWSPDGAKLLFYILINHDWDIGLVNANGSNFRILKKAAPNNHSYFSACWMPDAHSLFCQDLENLYRIGLDGEVLKQWSLRTLFPKGDMNSSSRMDVSPDGSTLLVEIDADENPGREDWDGPPPEIWTMDLATDKTARATSIFWWEPCWLTANEFLCIGQGAREKQPSIYRVSIDGKTRKLLVKNAMNPSVSR